MGILERAGLTGIFLIDVSIGIVFAMLTFSLVATAVAEAIAGVLNLRGAYLRRGIDRLLRDEALRDRVLSHPLIEGLKGPEGLLARLGLPIGAPGGRMPSSIPRDAFARALVEALVLHRDELVAKLTRGVHAAQPPIAAAMEVVDAQIRRLALDARTRARLSAVVSAIELGAAGADEALARTVDRVEAELATWFDAGMDRVTGWYVRRTKAALFVIGALAALAVNFDVIGYAAQLSRDEALRRAMLARAEAAEGPGDLIGLPGRPLTPGGTEAGIGAVASAGADTGAAIGAAGDAVPAAGLSGAEGDGAADADGQANAGAVLADALVALGDRTLAAGRALDEFGRAGAALGWSGVAAAGPLDWARMAASWLLVGLACTLGGQFWFDLLRTLFRVRAGAAGLNSDIERLRRSAGRAPLPGPAE